MKSAVIGNKSEVLIMYNGGKNTAMGIRSMIGILEPVYKAHEAGDMVLEGIGFEEICKKYDRPYSDRNLPNSRTMKLDESALKTAISWYIRQGQISVSEEIASALNLNLE